jgi:hypothetical protein
MGLFDKLFTTTKKFTVIHPNLNFQDLVNADFDPENGILSTLLSCHKILSDQLAKIPVEVYGTSKEKGKVKLKAHHLYGLLHNNPNSYQTSFSFFQTLEYHIEENHYPKATKYKKRCLNCTYRNICTR